MSAPNKKMIAATKFSFLCFDECMVTVRDL
jgi:hypothetical protein